jgi:hypothetical protein
VWQQYKPGTGKGVNDVPAQQRGQRGLVSSFSQFAQCTHSRVVRYDAASRVASYLRHAHRCVYWHSQRGRVTHAEKIGWGGRAALASEVVRREWRRAVTRRGYMHHSTNLSVGGARSGVKPRTSV